MGATEVDWSMGSQAARLADWDTALQIGKKVAGPGVPVPAVERARMREDFAELVPHAESLITSFSGLSVEGFRSRAWVMSRGEWIRANLNGLQRLIEPLAARVMADKASRASYKRKAMGAQAGALLGYVGKRVLGQYDVFVPPDDEGLLYFVGPNVAEVERTFGLPARDFRLWIAIHEVTHRVQFGAAPWLRDHLAGMIDTYLGSVSLDSKDLMNQLKRAADEAKEGVDLRGMGALFLILTPAQRELVMTLQGIMSLLEGHASFVMNEVGREHVADVDRMRRTLAKRRKSSNVERTFQKAIGFEQKIRQYDAGERFVREAVRLGGQDVVQPRVGAAGQPPDASPRSPTPPRGSRGWWSSRPDAPPPGRRPRPRAGHGHGPRARHVRAGRPRARLRLGRPGLGLPPRVARAAPAPVPDPARGLPLRSPAAPGIGGRRRVREAARRAASRCRSISGSPTDAPAEGESVEAWATGRRGQAMSRACAARVRRQRSWPRDTRSTTRPRRCCSTCITGTRARWVGRHLAGRPGPTSSRSSTCPAPTSRPSAARSACVHGATRRTRTAASCGTRSGSTRSRCWRR